MVDRVLLAIRCSAFKQGHTIGLWSAQKKCVLTPFFEIKILKSFLFCYDIQNIPCLGNCPFNLQSCHTIETKLTPDNLVKTHLCDLQRESRILSLEIFSFRQPRFEFGSTIIRNSSLDHKSNRLKIFQARLPLVKINGIQLFSQKKPLFAKRSRSEKFFAKIRKTNDRFRFLMLNYL